MPVPLLPLDTSLPKLRYHIVYTLKRLILDPRGEPFRQEFRELREEWKQLQLMEFDLQDNITEAIAGVGFGDFNLDEFVDLIDEETKNDPRIRALLLKGKTISAFKRPTAGAQLRAMELWGGTLANYAENPSLQAKAPVLIDLVTAARQAEAERDQCRQKLKEFYTIGARAQFIKKVNIARGKVYRYFSQLVSDHPELKLSHRYPYSFFPQRERERELDLEDEIALVEDEIEQKREELAVLEARLKELFVQKEAQDREAAEAEAREARIAELTRELAELKAKSKKKR